MIEVKLTNINFSVTPLDDDSKQVNFFHAPTETIYMAPFNGDALKVLLEQLSMSNEELTKMIERKRLEQELAVSPEEKAALSDGGIQLP